MIDLKEFYVLQAASTFSCTIGHKEKLGNEIPNVAEQTVLLRIMGIS